MKQLSPSFLSVASFFSTVAQTKVPVDDADPLLGTSESRWMLNSGTVTPFGMVQSSPDNLGGVWRSGYGHTLGSVSGLSNRCIAQFAEALGKNDELLQTNGGAPVKRFDEISSPIFERATIQIDPKYYKGESFTVIAKNTSDANRYVQSATLNCKPLTKPWFYHEDLADGGTLVLQMRQKPNMKWGSKPEEAPPSMSPIAETKSSKQKTAHAHSK